MPQPNARKKVKTGCRTCRSRKVKCDETKPACIRCQRAQRTCEGYGIWSTPVVHMRSKEAFCASLTNRSSISNGSSPWSGGSDPSERSCGLGNWPIQRSPTTWTALDYLDATEKGCFDWYLNRSVKKLSGAFRSESWIALLFQTGMIEASVLYSMLTLASAHREEVQGLNTEVDNQQSLLTYRECNKAVRHLRNSLNDKRVALISIQLLVAMDFLRGHYTSGLTHLQHGLKILQGVDNLSSYLDGWLITSFTRAFVQAKLLQQFRGSSFPVLASPKLECDLWTFRSRHHARRALESIFLRIFELQETGCSAVIQQELVVEVQRWIEVYEKTLLLEHELLEHFAFRLLRIHSRIAVVMAGVLVDASEMSYDQFEGEFLEIITRSIQGHKISQDNTFAHHDPEPTSPSSVTDIGWIPPLFFTATKCRNHRLRNQAVRLLNTKPHKEGIWSTKIAVEVAQKMIQLEEGGFYQDKADERYDTFAVPTQKELDLERLPEHLRSNRFDVLLPDDRCGRLVLSFRREDKCTDLEYDLQSDHWACVEATDVSISSTASV